MADNPAKTSTPDNDLISLSQPYEVRDWCKSLECTEADLRAAVKAVGNSARKKREHLAKDTPEEAAVCGRQSACLHLASKVGIPYGHIANLCQQLGFALCPPLIAAGALEQLRSELR